MTGTGAAPAGTGAVAPAAPVAPVAGTDVVDVWLVPTDQPEPVVRALYELLDPAERARADGPDRRFGRRFTVAHGAVRLLAGARLGRDPARLLWRYGPHGKPGFDGLAVNHSASGALAAVALTEGRAVGVDVERVRDARVAVRMARRWFPAAEAESVAADPDPAGRFTVLWCRREACVKAYGGRLVQGFGLPLDGPSPVLLADPGALGPGPCRVEDVPAPGGFRAAVATVGAGPAEVRRRIWSPINLP
ncbi:4'-phosphopantetheinyl transferase family protein [Kitasatospora purpeofusca]|uniref:4'-phosphopantetheinyl transferase family protein n=1 Tax=Kitasatospora purpeofusca TaxID=67352 RepID=UPI002252914A|nr:4'-phosphopantetheinyl transferase superfamily protein [Kitasatospora purpeofusca]MCX4755866.1 4'-phosphopantetheinyl transferase superfamily protein [Kitasatospora purpeofusca]WSR36280.1 4'-phosphopantetheinyl transferase superfamily protein [Kitasatospora purpeofusca]WSR44569.1 4'-phosphopantetheinyl transferase superfamily protein [Kitasatospora purpeofusca]